MLKMHQKPFGGQAPPGPAAAGELKRFPRPPSLNMGSTSKGAGRRGRREGKRRRREEKKGGRRGREGRRVRPQ